MSSFRFPLTLRQVPRALIVVAVVLGLGVQSWRFITSKGLAPNLRLGVDTHR